MSGERTLPGISLTGYWDAGTDGWKDGMDANLFRLSNVVQLTVKSRFAPLPSSPVDRDIYIVPSGGDAAKIAIRDLGQWVYVIPFSGWRAWVIDEMAEIVWTGSSWITVPVRFDVSQATNGAPSANQVVLKHVFTRPTTFADDFAGSFLHASVAATSPNTFTIRKNGTAIGTMGIGAGATGAVFNTTAGATSFSSGDVIDIIAPSSPDATLAGVAISLAGVR